MYHLRLSSIATLVFAVLFLSSFLVFIPTIAFSQVTEENHTLKDVTTTSKVSEYELRAQTCLSNAKQIEALISLWESQNLILLSGSNKLGVISPNGILSWDGKAIDLGSLTKDSSIFSCPETSASQKATSTYSFLNTDNSGDWILGTSKEIGGRGVVCTNLVNGRQLGELKQLGLDEKKESAHHHW